MNINFFFSLSVLVLINVACCKIPSQPTTGIELQLQPPFIYEAGVKCSIENGCLQISAEIPTEDSDALGNFTAVKTVVTSSLGSVVEFTVRNYDKYQVYEQFFVTGLNGTSMGDKDDVSTAWPIFHLPNVTEAPGLRFVTPGGYMLGWTLYAQGSIEENLPRFRDGESGGIVGLILPQEPNTSSVVMTALTEPMGANVKLVQSEELYLQWGVQGLAESIPVNYSIQFIVVPNDNSFNKNVMEWGKAFQLYHKTTKNSDFSVDYLGYWTDNGAAHYYNPLPYASYEHMILDVYNQTVANDIPIKYLQIDSWWYYKGEGGGVKNWTAKPYIFPNGIAYISSETGWPIVAHNRYFSNDTDYAQQNGGDYPFTIDQTTAKSLPLDKSFWDDLLDGGVEWGLITYEQDWLDRQYEGTSALHTNLTLGSYWLDSMGISAAERSVAVQYCMSFPRHFLHSAQLPAVTQIRVSDDYILTPNQWRIGITSLFANALGLKPYKDNFWTSKVNKNVPFNDCELDRPYDIEHPLKLSHSYGGRKNVTRNDIPCVPWTTFGYDVKYPHSGMRINLCRDPENSRRGSYCYTQASFDLPESEWKWELCKPPVCQIDCYTFNGIAYIGSYGITQSGRPCVNWDGEYGLNSTKCRNPTDEEAPWCYVTEDHSERDFCDNKCQEAVEPNSALQSAVSTLSTGPVGVGDRAENLNRDLIMKSCRTDGLLLKPSKPLTAIDFLFISSEYREIWTADSSISEITFGIIFLAEVDSSFTLSAFDLNLETALALDVVVWQNYPNEVSSIQVVAAGNSLTLPSCGGYLQFCLLYSSPLIQLDSTRIAILGEVSKWTPASLQRIVEISVIGSDITMIISGAVNESVSLVFFDERLNDTFIVICNFQSGTTMTLSVLSQQCT